MSENIWDASIKGDLERVKHLIEVKIVDINSQDKDGLTPLHWSCYYGHLAIIQYLFDKGADINIINNDGFSPLHCACAHINTVEYLISKGANINPTDKDGETPLHDACKNGHFNTVQYLIKKGAVIEITNNDGNTPLHIACSSGHLNVVGLLVNKGADTEIKNNDGRTPLDYARQNNKSEVVSFLNNYIEKKQRDEEIRAKIEEVERPLRQEIERLKLENTNLKKHLGIETPNQAPNIEKKENLKIISKSATDFDQVSSPCETLSLAKLTQNTNSLIKSLIRNEVIIVAGDGVSSSLTSKQGIREVTWVGLLDSLKRLILGIWSNGEEDNNFFKDWDDLNAFEKAQRLREFAERYPIRDYRGYVFNLLGQIRPDNEPINVYFDDDHNFEMNNVSIATVLSAFGIPIATTNYNFLLEFKLNRFYHNMEPTFDLADILHDFRNYIFHIHGTLYEASNIILEENDDTFDFFRLKMESFFPQKSILFIGCRYGALDYHFTSYYNLYPDLKHFILLRREEYDQLCNDPEYYHRFAHNIQRGSLIPIIYGENYNDLVPFLLSLLSETGITTFPSNAPPYIYCDDVRRRIEGFSTGGDWIISNPHL